MENERNKLISEAYPYLREYCHEKHGLEFQAVDMRWGVQSGARDDHSTMELCAEAIENSQQHSIGPNFVVNIYTQPILFMIVSLEYGYSQCFPACDFHECVRVGEVL